MTIRLSHIPGLRTWLPAALLAGSPLLAQTPMPMVELKAAPKPAEPEEKTVSFVFDDKPWKSVLDWYAKESGLGFYSSGNTTPAGSLTIKADPNKKYTIAQVTDLLNESLATQNMIIVRRTQTFTVLPADTKVPKDLLPKISLEELAKKGDTEMVEVSYALKALLAEDIVPQLQKRKGPFGEINALGSNIIIIADTARNVRQIIEDLKKLEAKGNDSITHACKYIRAGLAAEKLKELLTDASTQVTNAAAAAAQQQYGYGGYGNYPPGGYDPRSRDNRSSTPAVSTRFKSVQISVIDNTNTLIVTAPQDKIASANEILKEIDVPAAGGGKERNNAMELKTYHVPTGTAETVAKTLQNVFKSSSIIRIDAMKSGNEIMVYAPISDHFEIKHLLSGDTPLSSNSVIKVIRITSFKEPKDVVDQLKRLFPDTGGTGAQMDPQTDPYPGIIVKGTQQQVDALEAAYKAIDPAGGATGTGGLRVITIDNGNAGVVAEAIANMLRGTRSNPVEVKGVTPAPAPVPMPDKNSMYYPRSRGTQLVSHQIVDPQAQPTSPQPKTDTSKKPVVITVAGGKIIITSDDAEALELASQLARLYVKEATTSIDNLFEVIRLKNANAEEAAKSVNELFNGPTQPQQQQGMGGGGPGGGRGGGGGGGMFGGGLGMLANLAGFGGTAQAAAPPAQGRIRVVAEKQSNSLVVMKASPADMVMIKKMLEQVIDTGLDLTSPSAAKPHIVPLKYARCEDVKTTLNEVYANLTSSRSRGGAQAQAFPFPFPQQQQPQQQAAAQLTVSTEDRTNSVIVNCNDSLFAEVSKLVTMLDESAKNQDEVVRVVELNGIDPALVEQAIQALNGTPTSGTTGGNTGGGMSGFSPFGGGFGGGSMSPAGGGNRGGGTRGTGGGTRGGGGGTRGGGRTQRSDDGGGGRDFFEYRDMDVPSASNSLYDPEAPNVLPVQYTQPVNLPQVPQPMPAPQQPPVVQGTIPAPNDGVTAESIPNTQLLLLRAKNKEDMERILKFIEFIRKPAEQAQIKIQLVPMKHQDASSVVNILNTLFGRVQLGAGSTTLAPAQNNQRQGFGGGFGFGLFGGGFGQQNQATQTNTIGSIFLLPLPRFNSIMLAVPESRLKDVLAEIERIDQPNSAAMAPTAFPLKNASAQNVSQQIQTFFNGRYGSSETAAQNLIRVFFDANSNTVYVQASPADIRDITDIITRLDTTQTPVTNELKTFRLKYAYSDEIANVLFTAITSSAVNPNISANAAGTAGGIGTGQGLGATQFGTGAFGQGANAANTLGGANQLGGRNNQLGGGTTGATSVPTAGTPTKTTALSFYSNKDGKLVESGQLLDVHIIPDARINTLVISAPAATMRLIEKLIEELDVQGAAFSSVKVFTLKKADATTVATLIQQLFTSGSTTGGQNFGGNQFGNLFGGGGGLNNQQQSNRPLLTLTGDVTAGAALVDLRLSVDARTNSIIVAGSPTDLDTIRAIVAKLEDTDGARLMSKVYRLRNAAAADVQSALLTFMQSKLQAEAAAFQTVQQTMQRQIFIQPEPVSNTLLIAVAPEYYHEVVSLVDKIDSPAPQVFVSVMIAEVTLRNTEEFGMEIGLQSPVLFRRSATGTSPGNPGFNFNTVTVPTTGQFPGLPNTTIADQGVVGFQGLGNLGVGRSGSTGVGGFVFSAGSDAFNLLVRALKAQSRIDVLSRPQLLLSDNQVGFFQVGQQYPILNGQTTSPNVGVTNNITYLDIGITLRVTPRINPDGRVLMRVEPQIANPDPQLVLVGGQAATSFSTQSLQTTVLASDGETVVLGGLLRRSDNRQENKIPVLGDIPYLGAAFRYRQQNKERREIIFIVTPHLIRSEADMARVGAMETCKMNWVERDVKEMHTYGSELLSGRDPYANLPPGSYPLPQQPLPGGVQNDNVVPQGGFMAPDAPIPAPLPGTPISRTPGFAQQPVQPASATVPQTQQPAKPGEERPYWPARLEPTPEQTKAAKPAPFIKSREGKPWSVFGR